MINQKLHNEELNDLLSSLDIVLVNNREEWDGRCM